MNMRGSFLSAVLAMTVLSSCRKVDTANDWIYQLDDDQLAILKYLRPLTLKSSPKKFLANKRSMDDQHLRYPKSLPVRSQVIGKSSDELQYLRDPKFLPVHFLVDGKSSDDLTWVESRYEGILHNDHPDKATADQTRWSDCVTYRCKKFPLQLDVTLTHYQGYSVIEYDAVLTNEQDECSSRIQNLRAIDETIDHQAGAYVLHAVRGSTCSFTDFEPLCQRLNGTASYAVTNGKCTSDYMPCFNLENATERHDWDGHHRRVELAGQLEGRFHKRGGRHPHDRWSIQNGFCVATA